MKFLMDEGFQTLKKKIGIVSSSRVSSITVCTEQPRRIRGGIVVVEI